MTIIQRTHLLQTQRTTEHLIFFSFWGVVTQQENSESFRLLPALNTGSLCLLQSKRVNTQLSISSSAATKLPLLFHFKCCIRNVVFSAPLDSIEKKPSISERHGEKHFIWILVLPVAPFAAGAAAGGPGSGSVALRVARILPSEGPHVLVWVGSPHSAAEGTYSVICFRDSNIM